LRPTYRPGKNHLQIKKKRKIYFGTSMIQHPLQYSQKLDSQSLETIIQAALDILQTKGLFIQSSEACEKLAQAGAGVNCDTHHVFFPADMVLHHCSKAPSQWTLHARNPKKDVTIGGPNLVIAPGYGSAFVADIQGRRREATMTDFENLALMSYASDTIDITGGLLVEPNDISPDLRPLEITQALIRNSDKPFMGSVAGRQGAAESLEMARIVFGDIENKPCLFGLVNINSPLRLDKHMAEALITYANAGQPVLLTPGIMMGINAPVTLVGAITQALAELLGCVTLVQVLRPACPVIVGLGGVGSDLRNGGTGFGRPENALGIQLGAQIARHLKLPFRCSAAVTGSRRPDCRSGYERMMTAITAYNAGAHFCLQAAGILDSINMMSFEQYVIDIEIWSYIKRFAQSVVVNDETIGLDVIDFQTESYLANEHTIKHMRDQILTPALTTPDSYEQWWASDAKDVVSNAYQRVRQILDNTSPPALDEDIDRQLSKYVNQRRKILEKV
jgi:trimethylamine--corrinoid protein Co-methyltransferase